MSSCSCRGDDALAAFAATQSHHLRSLDDDVHRGLDVTACARCGQHFLTKFEERVRFDGDGDDQTWQVVALSDAEATALTRDTAARLFDGTRRRLVRHGGRAWYLQASSSSRPS